MNIHIEHLHKSFGKFPALHDVSLNIASGELIALIGPSGSGKTTLLRMLAGLLPADAGRIRFGERDVTNLGTEDRNVGLVFQHYALFPHMRVAGNVSFGLRVRPRATRPSKAEIAKRVQDWLKVVQLEGLEKRYPSQLSGGQRQRVGLARALAAEPDVLLLDEPFGALDALVRKDLRRWLRDLHDQVKLTGVIVTHDQEEALEVADRVVVLRGGVVQQVGTPWEVYEEPANRFVCEFLGEVNALSAEAEVGGYRVGPAFVAGTHAFSKGRAVTVYARPHEIELCVEPKGDISLPCTVERTQLAGPTARFQLKRADRDETLDVTLPHRDVTEQLAGLKPGDKVYAALRRVRSFPEDS
jgi:sulfate transport system ATP-binding protein